MSKYFSSNNYQAPAVYIEIMGVRLGLVDDSLSNIDISEDIPATPKSLIKFPNLIISLNVNKIVSGDMNKYTLVLKYLPQDNEDPSYIDKLLAANVTQNSSKIVISYGDTSTEGFFSRKDEAFITNYTMKMELETSAMVYTITAITVASALTQLDTSGNVITYEFQDVSDTHISKIYADLYNNPKYGLKDIFPGGIFIDKVNVLNITDKNRPDTKFEGTIPGGNMSLLEYLTALVSLMVPSSYGTEDICGYVYAFNDTYGSRSFEIYKSINDAKIVDELVIGSVDGSNITTYEFTNDFSALIAMRYGKTKDIQSKSLSKTYIDDNCNEVEIEGVLGNHKNLNTSSMSNDAIWWNSVSKLPCGLNISTRGMIRQLPLMSNIKVTIVIKGRIHFSSGIYSLMEVHDVIDNSGFYSQLKLLKTSSGDIEFNASLINNVSSIEYTGH